MKRQRKTIDLWAIEGYFYGTWEEENTETSRRDAGRSVREYRANNPGVAYRIRKYREAVGHNPTNIMIRDMQAA